MRTVDTHIEAGLAMVQDAKRWADPDNNTRYIPLKDAPPLSDEKISQTYLKQLHYVASHIAVGLTVNARVNEIEGKGPYPKTGWTRWRT